MIARTLLPAFFLLAACGDLPVEPVGEVEADLPGWCSPFAVLIEGRWERQQARAGHKFTQTIVLTKTSPCLYEYRYRIVQDEHEGIADVLIYQTSGQILISGHEGAGPLHKFSFETKKLFEQTINAKGDLMPYPDDVVYKSGEMSLWDDSLLLWGKTYQRKKG